MAVSTTSIPLDTTRTSLICGFLGAGKTTFIRHRLQHAGNHTAVLVNEFGSLGFDGTEIRQVGDVQVVELPGGCICCSGQLELESAIRDICTRYRPNRLFIEPSGVAEASAIVKILVSPSLQELITVDGVITVVDAESFLEYAEPDAFGTFFHDQVKNADLVLINKGDLVTTDQLKKVEHKVLSINNRALIASTSFGQLTSTLPVRHTQATMTSTHQSIPWEHICLTPAASFTRPRIEELGNMICEGVFGRVFRAKGVLALEGGTAIQLQFAGKRIYLEECLPTISPRLTCIGLELRRHEFETFFAQDINHTTQTIQRTITPYELS